MIISLYSLAFSPQGKVSPGRVLGAQYSGLDVTVFDGIPGDIAISLKQRVYRALRKFSLKNLLSVTVGCFMMDETKGPVPPDHKLYLDLPIALGLLACVGELPNACLERFIVWENLIKKIHCPIEPRLDGLEQLSFDLPLKIMAPLSEKGLWGDTGSFIVCPQYSLKTTIQLLQGVDELNEEPCLTVET